MTGVAAALRSALEEAGYDVRDVAENRGLVRVTLETSDASAPELRSIAETAVGDGLLGVEISTERSGTDAVGTVLSARHR